MFIAYQEHVQKRIVISSHNNNARIYYAIVQAIKLNFKLYPMVGSDCR